MQPKPWLAVVVSAVGLMFVGLAVGAVVVDTIYRKPLNTSIIPANVGATRVVATGDIACSPQQAVTEMACRQAATASLALALQPKAVLAVGDLQYQNGNLNDFQASYAKSWGQLKAITHPVPGNHEYQTAGAAGYFDYFGKQAGDRNKGYYSFDIGTWHVTALNSETDVSPGSAQRLWLKKDLAATRQPCIMAYWHKPLFSTGYHPGDAAYKGLWEDLYAAGADVVVNGHSHNYERFVPMDPSGKPDKTKGIVEFVAGMGGYGPEQLQNSSTTLVQRQNHAFGLLQFDLKATSLNYKFVTIPGSQEFQDEGVVRCHV
jgi:hypothetical protein